MPDRELTTDDADDTTLNRSPGLKVYFNPFNHTIEQNNEFLRNGHEPIPIRIPDTHHHQLPERVFHD